MTTSCFGDAAIAGGWFCPRDLPCLHPSSAGWGDSSARSPYPSTSFGNFSSVIAPSSIFEDGIIFFLLGPERALQPVSKPSLTGGFGERALCVCACCRDGHQLMRSRLVHCSHSCISRSKSQTPLYTKLPNFKALSDTTANVCSTPRSKLRVRAETRRTITFLQSFQPWHRDVGLLSGSGCIPCCGWKQMSGFAWR